MRDGLSYARRLAGRPVVLVKVDASMEARQLRGWVANPPVDESAGECRADNMTLDFWDTVYDNGVGSNTKSATEWTKSILIPAILKQCVRCLRDTPHPGVVYRDLIGGLLRQPFGLRLATSVLLNFIVQDGSPTPCDAIAVPEATGFLFAAPVANHLQVPLIVLRKAGRLPGDTCRICYKGSNISNLEKTPRNEGTVSLEMVDGSIQRGQHVFILDDCLASGSTAAAMVRLLSQQGAVVDRLVCVMELPDLGGREALRDLGVEVFSVVQFEGA